MGEVYRARDTTLNRDVALKVLPADMPTDPERLARFKREAQFLASLNHPNIETIYGLETVGRPVWAPLMVPLWVPWAMTTKGRAQGPPLQDRPSHS